MSRNPTQKEKHFYSRQILNKLCFSNLILKYNLEPILQSLSKTSLRSAIGLIISLKQEQSL